ncbi:Keratin, type I cytoskeletal [Merluccius polli]|uniref:Keratin, type I cytoskeletal n=1 Tax=Merluccius polli TaxID=89951 RepID=A0AA47P1M4_MERPO|nr:Keratin, type I cytoskeletal [Merluccius polli]
MDNARILLQIDNARLAADDFKMKYDNEHQIRQSVETDINGLRKVRDDLTVGCSDLEIQIEGLNEELVYLKKNHKEVTLVQTFDLVCVLKLPQNRILMFYNRIKSQTMELAMLRSQMSSGSVNVEVDAPAQQELSTVMETIRSQYEGIADKNRKEMEAWYKVKFDEVNKVVTTSVNTLSSSQSQITELKRTLQSLQIELQSQTSQKSALEGQLEETESRYNVQLNQLQAMVNCLESELGQVRMDIERQGKEYQILLDIKTRLELEIAEYRRLLDGESVTLTILERLTGEPVVTKRVKMVVEQIVDGKVVSHTEEVDEEIISQ